MRRKECVSRCFDICFDMLRCSLIEKRRVFKGQRHITTNTICPAAPRPSTFIKPIRPRQTKTKKFAQTKIRLNTFKYVETCIISIEFVYNPQQEFWDCLGEHSTPTSISVENPRSNESNMIKDGQLMSSDVVLSSLVFLCITCITSAHDDVIGFSGRFQESGLRYVHWKLASSLKTPGDA